MNQEQFEEVADKGLRFLVVLLVGALGILQVYHVHRYKKLDAAYKAALGAYLMQVGHVTSPAEAQSMRTAVELSEPSVVYYNNQVARRVDGSTYTISGLSPVTDFGIVREADGTWHPAERKKIKYFELFKK